MEQISLRTTFKLNCRSRPYVNSGSHATDEQMNMPKFSTLRDRAREVELLRGLLEAVSQCFTRDDALPDNLLVRIDEALASTGTADGSRVETPDQSANDEMVEVVCITSNGSTLTVPRDQAGLMFEELLVEGEQTECVITLEFMKRSDLAALGEFDGF